MIAKGRLEEILVNIEPNIYSKCVVLEKGFQVLYAKLQKSLYDFIINPYDP